METLFGAKERGRAMALYYPNDVKEGGHGRGRGG